MPTQTTSTTVHLSSTANDETWIIAPNVTVSSDSFSIAFEAAHTGVTLINHGSLLTPFPVAPGFTVAGVAMGAGASIFNEGDGVIAGLNGIVASGGDILVVNLGQVTGFSERGVILFGNGNSVYNEMGGVITGLDGIRVDGGFGSTTLVANRGTITAFGQHGVLVLGEGASILNDTDGVITGAFAGIRCTDDGILVRNRGTVTATVEHGVHFSGAANSVDMINSGYIYGALGGVTASSGSAVDVDIRNSGVIESDQYGVWLLNADFALPLVRNTGTISGAVASVFVENDERVFLDNRGTLDGDVLLTSVDQNDIVVNRGTIDGNVKLGSGNDSFNGVRGTSGRVFGEGGNDALFGGADADTLHGGGGDDVLTGGLGRDILKGSAGADRFDFNSIAESRVGPTRDVIADFSHAEGDKIDLSTIDANTTRANNQKFFFIGTESFASFHDDHPAVLGMVRFAGGILQGNVNGNFAADFEIRVGGVSSLVAADFVL